MPQLLQRFHAVRQRTLRLAEPLSAEDACVQSMPDASPAKWHLAHTTWFFETFVLGQEAPFDPDFRVLFNSYYQQVGERHPRAQRGLLTRPSLARVRDYRAAVDARMQALLVRELPTPLADLVELGLQHEQQHQELLLTDIKHLLSCHPQWPAYQLVDALAESGPEPDLLCRPVARGMHEIGHAGAGFAFDNERPRHAVFLPGNEIASRPVSNAEFLRFVEAGGYRQPQWWLAEGWDWRCAQQIEHPWYWRQTGAGWQEFSLHGALPLHGHRPVAHVSYYEADAYARWAGARLPTEAEWEVAWNEVMGRCPARESLHPTSLAGDGLGQVWGLCCKNREA